MPQSLDWPLCLTVASTASPSPLHLCTVPGHSHAIGPVTPVAHDLTATTVASSRRVMPALHHRLALMALHAHTPWSPWLVATAPGLHRVLLFPLLALPPCLCAALFFLAKESPFQALYHMHGPRQPAPIASPTSPILVLDQSSNFEFSSPLRR
jgi:hypothetical protein